MSSLQPETTETTLSRTMQSYDELPYVSKPFSQTHPSRLAAIAHLFGLETPPVATARVLELGCAAGGNIIPLAAYHPEGRFLGVDFSKRQVDDGRERIARVGLTNIEIRQQSITELGEEIGEFDYIIAHGLLSWVPLPVRDAVMRICSRHLSANGIAYISYNVLPGWHLKQPLRDAFRLMIPSHLDPLTRVSKARGLLELMKAATIDNGAYGQILRGAPDMLAGADDEYIFHDYMEETNFPLSFSDFQTMARSVNLGYLGEADLHTMIASNYGKQFAEHIANASANNITTHEQMLDILTGRGFRQTLLVRGERLPDISRRLPAERIEALHLTAPKPLRFEMNDGVARLFVETAIVLESSEPALVRLAQRLGRPFISSLSCTELMGDMPEDDARKVRSALYRLIINGVLRPNLDPMPAAPASFMPRAAKLARADAASGAEYTSNARHDAVKIDPIARILLPHLDGQCTRRRMEELLVEGALAGKLTLKQNNTAITDPGMLRNAVLSMLPRFLDSIATSGVFEA